MEISWLTGEQITGSQAMGHQYFPPNHKSDLKKLSLRKTLGCSGSRLMRQNCIWVCHSHPRTFLKLIAQLNIDVFLEPITSPQDCNIRQEIPHRQARPARSPDFARESWTLLFLREIENIFSPWLQVSSLSSTNYKQIQFWQSPLGKIMLTRLSKIPLLLRLSFFSPPWDFTAVSHPPAFFSCTAFCSALNGQSRNSAFFGTWLSVSELEALF